MSHDITIGPSAQTAADIQASLIRGDVQTGQAEPPGPHVVYKDDPSKDTWKSPREVNASGAASCNSLSRAAAPYVNATHVGVVPVPQKDGSVVHHNFLVTEGPEGAPPIAVAGDGTPLTPIPADRIHDESTARGMNGGKPLPLSLYQAESGAKLAPIWPPHVDDLSHLHDSPAGRAAEGKSYQGADRLHVPLTDAGQLVAETAHLAARAVTPPVDHEPKPIEELYRGGSHPFLGGVETIEDRLSSTAPWQTTETLARQFVDGLVAIQRGAIPGGAQPGDPAITLRHRKIADQLHKLIHTIGRHDDGHPEAVSEVASIAEDVRLSDPGSPKGDVLRTAVSEVDGMLPGTVPHALRRHLVARSAGDAAGDGAGGGGDLEAEGLALGLALGGDDRCDGYAGSQAALGVALAEVLAKSGVGHPKDGLRRPRPAPVRDPRMGAAVGAAGPRAGGTNAAGLPVGGTSSISAGFSPGAATRDVSGGSMSVGSLERPWNVPGQQARRWGLPMPMGSDYGGVGAVGGVVGGVGIEDVCCSCSCSCCCVTETECICECVTTSAAPTTVVVRGQAPTPTTIVEEDDEGPSLPLWLRRRQPAPAFVVGGYQGGYPGGYPQGGGGGWWSRIKSGWRNRFGGGGGGWRIGAQGGGVGQTAQVIRRGPISQTPGGPSHRSVLTPPQTVTILGRQGGYTRVRTIPKPGASVMSGWVSSSILSTSGAGHRPGTPMNPVNAQTAQRNHVGSGAGTAPRTTLRPTEAWNGVNWSDIGTIAQGSTVTPVSPVQTAVGQGGADPTQRYVKANIVDAVTKITTPSSWVKQSDLSNPTIPMSGIGDWLRRSWGRPDLTDRYHGNRALRLAVRAYLTQPYQRAIVDAGGSLYGQPAANILAAVGPIDPVAYGSAAFCCVPMAGAGDGETSRGADDAATQAIALVKATTCDPNERGVGDRDGGSDYGSDYGRGGRFSRRLLGDKRLRRFNLETDDECDEPTDPLANVVTMPACATGRCAS